MIVAEKRKEVVRVAQVENATLILGIDRDSAKTIRKEIRHRLDNQRQNDTSGRVHYVDPDYEIDVVEREDTLEVIATGVNLSIRMDKHIPERIVYNVIRKTLEAPQSVICAGMFDVREHYTIEIVI